MEWVLLIFFLFLSLLQFCSMDMMTNQTCKSTDNVTPTTLNNASPDNNIKTAQYRMGMVLSRGGISVIRKRLKNYPFRTDEISSSCLENLHHGSLCLNQTVMNLQAAIAFQEKRKILTEDARHWKGTYMINPLLLLHVSDLFYPLSYVF